ncbi:peptide ABC transporter substrate-binding protein [Lonepinella sp. BR2474]|uniref:peptide ABC transporter substrate-binding protein n=1 Tax=Lonepinella sp. BR2474 TaxID=3434548 RepID=UPI003F6E1C78
MHNKIIVINAVKVAMLAIFSLICLSACEPNAVPEKTQSVASPTDNVAYQSDVLVRGVYGPFMLQPEQIQQPEQTALLRDLFEGLVIYDPQGNIIAGVAESWKSADQKTWIFTLRKQAKWSNGDPVTAQDFVQSWQQLAGSANPQKQFLRYMNMQNAAAVLAQSMPVQQLGVQALDDSTLQIRLDKPTPYLPKMLAHVALLPQYQGATPTTTNIISNGAYVLAEQGKNQLRLQQNPSYWQANDRAFGQVIYQQITPDMSPSRLDIIQNSQQGTDHISYFPQLCTYFYEFNFRDPLLQKKAVRNALSAMIPSNIVPSQPFMLPNGISYLPDNMQFEQERDFEPTVVEQQLQHAGITESQPLMLRLAYDNHGLHAQIAEHLIRVWSQSDLIRIQADPVSYQTLLEKHAQGDFQLIRSGWCADYNDPSAFLSLLHSQSADNKMGFSDPEMDHLLEKALSAKISEQERTALYRKAIARSQQEYVVMPIFQYAMPVRIAPSVAGYDLTNPTSVIYSKDLYRLNLPKSTDTK